MLVAMDPVESSYYVHAIDPVLIQLWGPFAVRWYGLAYVAGFALAYAQLIRWARSDWFRISVEEVQTLIVFAIFGVMLGGRLGYLFFYDFPAWRTDPALLFRVWEGGMASHGGLLGLTLAMYLFARVKRVPFLHVADAMVCAGSIGIFFGRIANFINGELWGRVTDVRWAVIFPQAAEWSPALGQWVAYPRHPSQLYGAVLEGLLVWGILQGLRKTAWARQRDGRLGVAFLVLYAVGRISVEFFREPEILYFGWLTQGQLLSALMFVPAIWVGWFLHRPRA